MKKIGANLYIDEDILDLSFACRTELCNRSCCKVYSVDVTARDVRQIGSIMDDIARYQPMLRRANGSFHQFTEPDEEEEEEALIIRPWDKCFFLYRDNGDEKCAIHAACLEHGHSLKKFKPRTCMFWPLIVSFTRAGKSLRVELAEDFKKHRCIMKGNHQPMLLELRPAFEHYSSHRLYRQMLTYIDRRYGVPAGSRKP